MDLITIIINHFFLVLSFLVGLIVLLRNFRKHMNPGHKKHSRLRLAGAFLGNALIPLHAIIHPHTKHVVAETLHDRDEDPDADPTDPAQHLQRQLKKIRNGEQLDHITTLLR
jgi:hypothetical protein